MSLHFESLTDFVQEMGQWSQRERERGRENRERDYREEITRTERDYTERYYRQRERKITQTQRLHTHTDYRERESLHRERFHRLREMTRSKNIYLPVTLKC